MHNNVILKLYTFLSNFSLFPLQIRKVCWLCADICGTTRSPWNASRYTHLFHRAVTEQGRHISSGFVLKCKYNLFLEINKSGNRFFFKRSSYVNRMAFENMIRDTYTRFFFGKHLQGRLQLYKWGFLGNNFENT